MNRANLEPQELYFRLVRLIEAMPTVRGTAGNVTDIVIWVAKAEALLHKMMMLPESLRLAQVASGLVDRYQNHDYTAEVHVIMQRALARAELDAPVTSSGTFIPVGTPLDAMNAIGKVLTSAKKQILIVDPYMDAKVLTDFAVLAPEKVELRLLTDNAKMWPSFQPAVERWRDQYKDARPLLVQVAWQKRTLHDRVIIIDEDAVYTLSQSFNALAVRSPASIVRLEGDVAALKKKAYLDYWVDGIPLPNAQTRPQP